MSQHTPARTALVHKLRHPASFIIPAARADDTASMADFDHIVNSLKDRYDIRVRRWRKTMTGCAWRVYFHDGRAINWVEAPYPKSPISLAIFLHEIGHHVIGFSTYKRRCEEEYHAWVWAIREMKKLGVAADRRVQERFARSMEYAVAKAMRRGIKTLPRQLATFLPKAA
ncbi:MAG: hypothetical protein H7144_06200 [Burkholderiales bacterium]|nr:hypothetical protein [Phycisphaerae bacterium]